MLRFKDASPCASSVVELPRSSKQRTCLMKSVASSRLGFISTDRMLYDEVTGTNLELLVLCDGDTM